MQRGKIWHWVGASYAVLRTSILGKVPAEVAKRAKQFQLPVIALVGTVGKDAQINLEAGIDSFVCILGTPCSLSDAIQNTPALLTRTAEQVMRLINIGRELKP